MIVTLAATLVIVAAVAFVKVKQIQTAIAQGGDGGSSSTDRDSAAMLRFGCSDEQGADPWSTPPHAPTKTAPRDIAGQPGSTFRVVVDGEDVSNQNPTAWASASNFALGFFSGHRYVTASLACAPGDILAVLTDVLIEIFDRTDREFGLNAVKQVLAREGDHSLDRILASVVAAARHHGPQTDDQTALLVRFLE